MPTRCDTGGAPAALPRVEEDEVVVAAQAGDRDVLGKLLHGYTSELRSRLAGQIGRPYRALLDASDVIQVTFLEAFLRIRQFKDKGEGSFLAWLTQAAENNLRDAIRALNREKRRPKPAQRDSFSKDGSWTTLAAIIARSSSTPSRMLSLEEAKEFLGEAIPKLPPVYRKVIELYDLMGLPAEEVGKLIDARSRAAVYMLSARAKEHLADLLGGWAKFFSSK